MIQIFIGEEESLHFMLNGQRVNNPSSLSLSLSLSGSLYLSMCAFTPHLHGLFFSPLSFSFSPRDEEEKRGGETEKGEGKDGGQAGTRVGEGAAREGLGIASCIGEHKRSRNNTIGRRASTVSRVHALFVRRHAWLGSSCVVRADIRRRGTVVRGPRAARRNARVRAS